MGNLFQPVGFTSFGSLGGLVVDVALDAVRQADHSDRLARGGAVVTATGGARGEAGQQDIGRVLAGQRSQVAGLARLRFLDVRRVAKAGGGEPARPSGHRHDFRHRLTEVQLVTLAAFAVEQ